MSANTIGTGAVVLTANADQLVAGLDRAKQKTDQWAASTKKSADKKGGGWKGNDVADVLGLQGADLVKGGLKLGAWGVAAAGVLSFGKHLNNTIGPMKQINAELERADKAHEKYRDRLTDTVDQQKEWIDSMKDIAGTTEGAAKIAGHTAIIGNNIEAAQAELKNLQKQAEDKGSWGSWDSWTTWAAGGLDAQKKGIEARTEATKAALAQMEATKKAVDRQKWLLANPTQNAEALSALKDFNKAMRDQARIAGGVASEWIQIEDLQKKFNLNAAQVDGLKKSYRDMIQAKNAAADMEASIKAAAATPSPTLAGAFAQGSTGAYTILAKHSMQNGGGKLHEEVKIAKATLVEIKDMKKAILQWRGGFEGVMKVID